MLRRAQPYEKRVQNLFFCVTEYTGKYVYKNGQLQYLSTSGGYATPEGNSYRYVYQYKDHLGNTRLSYTKNEGTGNLEIIEENNYYPFGLKHKGYNSSVSSLGNSTAQSFKFNGIEFEESLGLNLYEMDLRKYDPAIARWTGIDPITHHSMSTYTAFDNNPVFWADPSGADGEHYNWNTGRYENDQGEEVSFETALASVNGGGDKKKNQDGKKKYQAYNVVPFSNLNIDNELNPDTFTTETGYGEDPQGLHADKANAIITLLDNLTDKGKIKLLRSLGVGLKTATGILKKLEILGADPFAIYNDGLGALPGIGPIVGSYSDQFNSEQRAIENEVKWDNARSSFDDLINQSDLTNVILIYTNENLFQTNSVKGSEVEVLQDRNPTQDYKYIYYGTQTGDNLYIFGKYDNQF